MLLASFLISRLIDPNASHHSDAQTDMSTLSQPNPNSQLSFHSSSSPVNSNSICLEQSCCYSSKIPHRLCQQDFERTFKVCHKSQTYNYSPTSLHLFLVHPSILSGLVSPTVLSHPGFCSGYAQQSSQDDVLVKTKWHHVRQMKAKVFTTLFTSYYLASTISLIVTFNQIPV